MNLFDIILVQPIFNVLILIYGLIPGQDFGVSLIIFTILVRLLMWPLIKKQLHQTKVMRQLQPELAKIKAKAKGNRQLEATMAMELYKERGVSPFSSIGTLLMQLPIFIALFAVVTLITGDHSNIAKFTYDFLEGIPGIQSAIATHLNDSLFGIDLTQRAFEGSTTHWPLLVMAVVAAILQYFQSKMLLPQPKEKKRLRDMLKEQANGKGVDQAEMSAQMTSKMIWLFPILTFWVSTYLSGALVLYLLTTNAIAILQQYIILHKDEEELTKVKVSDKTKTRVQKAVDAEVVEATPKKGSTKKKRR